MSGNSLTPLLSSLQITSPDMLIDGYDQYDQQENEVVDISPSDAAEETIGTPLRADDFEAMKRHVLVDMPDLETEAEAYHTWHIEKWKAPRPRREHGPTFECGGFPWRVLFFPFGNSVECASFYLEHGFEGDPPPDWYACVQFALVLWNPKDPTVYHPHHATHRFNAKEADWGFTRFVELRKAFQQPWDGSNRTLIENDEAMLTAYVRIIKDPTGVLWHNFEGYDSKKVTGMVGLKNQGATCYLNSLIQSLYFTDTFRNAVYQIPTENEATRANSAWALQRLFYRLQRDKSAVSTNELTSSFGWDTRQIFEQQDVQELSRKLMEVLEKKMKNTPAERTLTELFVGKSKTYISCINVDYESSRVEDFWDIQLNVSNCKNLHESFMDYIQVETLEGENKYDAGEPYKLQDAKKGVIFESFPPVLHLQLKRFQYDIDRDAMVKVNDRHEFPNEIDLAPYLSKDADRSESWVYQLHSVLVHSGDSNAGHYYAFLKPNRDGFFYKFDDDRVTRATMKEVLEENYGGDYATSLNGGLGQRQPYMRGYSTKRSMSAYMLVYIRKSRLDQVLGTVADTDIPSHIEKRIAEEQAEMARRKKAKDEEHLYLNLGLITEQSFNNHHGFDLTNYDTDANDPAAPVLKRLLKTMKVSEFAASIAREQGLEDDQIRFWVMVGRQNKTNRPDQPIRATNATVEEAMYKYGTRGKPFYLWAESCPKSADGKVVWPETLQSNAANAPILVFLKYFDVQNQTLSGVGHIYVKKNDKVSDAAPQICKLMEWEATTPLLLFEEIKFSMIESMKMKSTFQQSEIQDGDIICFQKNLTDLDPATTTYTDARQYYDYLLNKIPVNFSPRITGAGDTFALSLSKKMTYDQFSLKVGEYLKVDPTHLRFATVNASTGKPKNWVKRGLNQTLHQVLQSQYSTYGGYSSHRSDALYYEVLEVSLADYETKRSVKLFWLYDGISKDELFEVLVPKNGLIADIINGLVKKLNVDETAAKNIRLIEVSNSKIHKELNEDHNVSTLNDYSTLYAEKIPDEELEASDDDKFVYCFHYDREPARPHGIPFKFVLKPDEKFSETRERIGKRTGLKGKPLQMIKFAVVSRGNFQKPRPLEDIDVLYDIVQDGEEMLGLDHVNKQRSFWRGPEGFSIK